MGRIMGVLSCLAVVFICSCGSSSGVSSGSSDPGAATTYPVVASVETPALSNLAVPLGAAKGSARIIKDTLAEGVVVQAQNAAGEDIGEPCTTGADGTCTLNLTALQLEKAVFTSENMHSYQEFDSADIAAIAETPLTAPINVEEDVVYAVVVNNCGGTLSACPATIDTGCLHDAVAVLPSDDQPGTDTVDGYIEALVVAQRTALVNNPAAATSGLVAALGGDPAAFVADVGADTVSSVPVADAVTNSQVGASTINTSYCTRDSADAASPWETAKAAAPTIDKATFGMAMAGMFEYFPPSELQQGLYPPADFRAFMANGPQLTDFFPTVGGAGNGLARNAFVQGFKNGMFADPLNAPVAIGFIGATFPAPVGGVIPWTANAFDPQTAVMAGRNAFMEMTNTAGFNPASFTPNGVHGAFQGALADPTRRTTFANGGVADFVGAFMGNPGGFVPADNFGMILAPPGAACTSNSDCLPCDNCVSSVCVVGSSKMGSTCSTDSDCDSITTCVGPPNSTYANVAMKNCICPSAVPMGMGVFTGASGTAPQPYNPLGGSGSWQPPAVGAQGGPCISAVPGQPPYTCPGGGTCTDPVHGGMCAAADFRPPPGSACTSNSQCMQGNTCTGGVCMPGAGQGGSRTNGMACGFPNECQSFNCMGGICTAMGDSGGDKKPDGVACAIGTECGSGFCNASLICGQPGGGAADGAWCNNNDMCLSHHCNTGAIPTVCGPM